MLCTYCDVLQQLEDIESLEEASLVERLQTKSFLTLELFCALEVSRTAEGVKRKGSGGREECRVEGKRRREGARARKDINPCRMASLLLRLQRLIDASSFSSFSSSSTSFPSSSSSCCPLPFFDLQTFLLPSIDSALLEYSMDF